MLSHPWGLVGGKAVLIGAGDIAKCGSKLKNAEATAKVLDRHFAEAGSEDETVVFTLGDNVYPSANAKEFRKCYGPTWGRHKEHTRPALGNHEYRSQGARPYFDYFGNSAGGRGKGYYSYDLGDWHVIVLNSACKRVEGGCGEGSPQHQWLVEDLEKHPNLCTIAYFHHPLFSSGPWGRRKAMKPLYQAMYDAGVEAVLSGHDHHYERFARQTPDGAADPVNGIRQFIVGTGGRGKRLFLSDRLDPRPNSEVRNGDAFGVLKLTLHKTSYDWEFLPVEGETFRDEGSDKCH